ncbi:hypothetical protein M441DRAFT_130021 [Trichoderma asperellum CBS 433.97]|uniref:Uncharacterized protein n=1 Tax=Trichoderma asperellum (strain ATCC 204424 / CBS 433.97 / NBRC 101777) TaxID=1042311 RepID=A0A2T3ZKU2_TRIA4|nr:hypothetical protein M441DRAFT_130021 [Trichoderma asperellum CBS 433.97]PTB45419.1 hypothetical protein M441DRAFT_130021 [Trichoderma asperellum CBS 433.97]
MECFENKLSPCFERSTSRESVLEKDKPSPLRIIKKSRHYSRQRTFKNNSADTGVDDSPHGSWEDGEPPRVLKLPRRRPKIVSKTRAGHASEESTDGDRISSTCTLPIEHSDIWLDDVSRASSRCTYHEQRNSQGLAELPFLSKPLLAEETVLVLSPHINVIPETMSMHEGQQHLWAAIEVCGRLFPAYTRPENDRVPCPNKDTFLKFGCLYDLTIDVLPTTQSSIVQTRCRQAFPATMFVGSSVLLLVQVVLQPKTALPSPRQHKHSRQTSEELMEDLQLQLGDSIMEYMSIHVSYSHSAFPLQRAATGATEVFTLQTRLVTKAEATIKLHNVLSPWSPHPIPTRDRLFSVIESHWGPQKASEIMQQIVAQHPIPAPKLKKIRSKGHEQKLSEKHLNYSDLPTIPLRYMSLQEERPTVLKSSPSLHSVRENRVSYDSGIGMKGASGREVSEARKCSKEENDISLRGRWSVSPDATLRVLTPALRNNSRSHHNEVEDYKSNMGKNKKHGIAGDVKGKKDSGIWAWATWF